MYVAMETVTTALASSYNLNGVMFVWSDVTVDVDADITNYMMDMYLKNKLVMIKNKATGREKGNET